MIITSDGFIEIDITDEMFARAKTKADEMGALRNSIRNGQGNLAGFLGEEVVLTAWGCAESQNTYQHDVTFEGVTFEVKSKDRTVPPRLDYMASVANYNPRQRADFYVFTSLVRPNKDDRLFFTKGYVIGIMSKEDYLRQATFMKKGQIDPTDPRGWTIKADCYNLAYQHLHRFHDWVSVATILPASAHHDLVGM